MKIKLFLLLLIILSITIMGCMRPNDSICNYDGVCEDSETDDCVDCIDVLGRGVQIYETNITVMETSNNS